jgi:cytochrome o ubiquinol oxidase operon protein cyoD
MTQTVNHNYSTKSYTLGFVLSIIFTLIPFYVIKVGGLSNTLIIICIFLSAIIQLFIQLFFFMHLGEEKGPKYNNGSLLFTILTTLIFVLGTIWIMFSLSYRMHPTMMHDNHKIENSDNKDNSHNGH